MKIFHCDHCGHLVFFENFQCVKCEHPLAFLPDVADMGSLEEAGAGRYTSPAPDTREHYYHLCENYTKHNVCNWVVPADDPNPLCASCRLTQVIPDLDVAGHKESWYKLEVAKRRLIHSLIMLRLPILNRIDDPKRGLAFEFKADAPKNPVLTGHADGVITINVAEADDAEREKRRVQLHEPYRTLLGHFRHEVGHYYWDRLIRDGDRLDGFRELFGDDRRDYGEALQEHYKNGPPPDWQQRHVTSYASAHPWEDWAETWAHYLHMVDVLETASACGLSLRPRRRDEPELKATPNPANISPSSFDRLVDAWFPLTYALNELNRGMGLADGYPFVLSPPAVEKLRFIHETIGTAK